MTTLNIYDKLWFSDVKKLFQEKGYKISYNTSNFIAYHSLDRSKQFTINITANEIIVVIPLQKDYNYKCSFTEYFKVAEYLIYHIIDNHKNIESYEVIDHNDALNVITSN